MDLQATIFYLTEAIVLVGFKRDHNSMNRGAIQHHSQVVFTLKDAGMKHRNDTGPERESEPNLSLPSAAVHTPAIE